MSLDSVQSAFNDWEVPADGTAHMAPPANEPYRPIPGGFYPSSGSNAVLEPPAVLVSKKSLATTTANMTKQVVCVSWNKLRSSFAKQAAQPPSSIASLLDKKADTLERFQEQVEDGGIQGSRMENKDGKLCAAYKTTPIGYSMPSKLAGGLRLPLGMRGCGLQFERLVVSRLVSRNCRKANDQPSERKQCERDQGSQFMNMTSTSGEFLEAPMLCKDEKYMCPFKPSFMCSYWRKEKDPVTGKWIGIKQVRPNVCLASVLAPNARELVMEHCGAAAFTRETKCCASTNLVFARDSSAQQQALDKTKFMNLMNF